MGFNARGFTVTNAGLSLLSKTQTGGTICYTRFALGDGMLGASVIATLPALISERTFVPVENIKGSGPRWTLGSKLVMAQVDAPFYWREWGIFAMDGESEIMYAYASTETPERLDPSGGVTDKILSATLEVGAAHVNIVANPSVLVSKDDLDEATKSDALLDKLKSVDGPGSGLDADLLDGKHASAFSLDGHSHPAQTSVSGNAGTATKLQAARNISITGNVAAAGVAFDGSADIALAVTDVDATKLNGQPASYYAAATRQYAFTVTESDWNGTEAPYTATVTVAGVPAGAGGIIGLSDAATAAEREVARGAIISPAASAAANTVKLVADGDKPTIPLPMVATIVG